MLRWHMTSAVVVTGAASGIGRACVEVYAERGFNVVAVDVNAAGLAELPDGVVSLVGDTSDEATNLAMVELARSRFGGLDAAVLNAGIGGTVPIEADHAIERFDRILAVNVRGIALGIRACLPALRTRGGGAIVVTSSVSGLRGDPGTWAYATSKAAVINLVRSIALDYAHENIRVNALAPGLTETALTERSWSHPGVSSTLLARVPMHRWSTPRDQAEAAWFLTSPAASFITGIALPVDGGVSASTGLLAPPVAQT
jgi:meso-butanediol dehydrogenase / (S,S)-butanediol dehydrogenase / diacetyl reductase